MSFPWLLLNGRSKRTVWIQEILPSSRCVESAKQKENACIRTFLTDPFPGWLVSKSILHREPRPNTMSIYLLALLIGVVAGLRAMTAPAVTSWAARLGWLNLTGTPLAFLNFAYT